jgi:hypothetical protein
MNKTNITRIAKRTRHGYRGFVTVYEGGQVQKTIGTKLNRHTPVEALHDAEMLRRELLEESGIAQVK